MLKATKEESLANPGTQPGFFSPSKTCNLWSCSASASGVRSRQRRRVHMEVTDDGGWHAGAEVRIVGLVKTPQHNGKVGIISAKAPGTEGRVGVELGKGKPIALRRENLELVKAPQANGQAPETGPAVDAAAKAASEAARRELIVAKVAAARAAQAAAEAEAEAKVEADVEADVLAGVRALQEAAG